MSFVAARRGLASRRELLALLGTGALAGREQSIEQAGAASPDIVEGGVDGMQPMRMTTRMLLAIKFPMPLDGRLISFA